MASENFASERHFLKVPYYIPLENLKQYGKRMTCDKVENKSMVDYMDLQGVCIIERRLNEEDK